MKKISESLSERSKRIHREVYLHFQLYRNMDTPPPIMWLHTAQLSNTISIKLDNSDILQTCSYCGESIDLFFVQCMFFFDRKGKKHWFHTLGKCHPLTVAKNDPQWWEENIFQIDYDNDEDKQLLKQYHDYITKFSRDSV